MSVETSAFERFPVLRTKRLTLRALTPADADALFAIRATRRVNEFIGRADMTDPADARRLVDDVLRAYAERRGIAWAGVRIGDDVLLGTCGFNTIDVTRARAEIGGELTVAEWGKNLAIEAFTAIVRFGLDDLRLEAIDARVAPANRSAIALLKKSGFERQTDASTFDVYTLRR